jgi:hypothetical protein
MRHIPEEKTEVRVRRVRDMKVTNSVKFRPNASIRAYLFTETAERQRQRPPALPMQHAHPENAGRTLPARLCRQPTTAELRAARLL